MALWIFLWGKSVPPITKLLFQHNSANLLPFSFMFPRPCLPIACSKFLLSAPTLAFRSPMTRVISDLFALRSVFSSVSWNASFSSVVACSVGA